MELHLNKVRKKQSACHFLMLLDQGRLGGSDDWASAFSSGHLRVLGSSLTSGSWLSGESASPSPSPSAYALCVCLSLKINK